MFFGKTSSSSLYDYSGGYAISPNVADGVGVWTIIAIVLAIVGGILIYTLFLTKRNDGKLKGFMAWLYDFLKFRVLTIEVILKVVYIIGALAITLLAFNYFATGVWWMFFVQIILGNIVLRVVYELILITILMWRNTEEIKKSLQHKK
ncbi:MAG: hypothetical protein LBK50_01355 [Candidatus Nomurabacteria bacterium]|jgi:hypothetical protein|nr:hypothetical protein [Candidatus Nomurabacteria bacterium]